MAGRWMLAALITAALPGRGDCPGAAPPVSGGLPAVQAVPAFPHLQFRRPLYLTYAPDDPERFFVVEQEGRVHTFKASPGIRQTRVFLDLRAKVRTVHNEEGFLALAFHPRYEANRFFYVYYSASAPRRGVLSRFRVSKEDPARVDSGSESVLLEVLQPYGNHNGSTVIFGPDGFLYMSLGDGGSAGDPHGHAQNLSTLLGSILRIDVDHEEGGRAYSIPKDNPFVGKEGARGEIWAYGLRNVWRMSFDRKTGDLWAGDVGQDAWEEIDRIVKGGNYGWNLREGRHPFKPGEARVPLIDPVFEYSHDVGASVTGGHVYRGTKIPGLEGAYVFADYVTGDVWALRHDGRSVTAHKRILAQPRNISSFGEGPDGELYLTAFDGRIYRLARR